MIVWLLRSWAYACHIWLFDGILIATKESPEKEKQRDNAKQFSCKSKVKLKKQDRFTSTNSGWIVVEWIPSLWKNDFTSSAILM